MISNKPYLVRAFYQWIVDSGCTPFLVVNANAKRCVVPTEHVENGEITLNVSPEAIRDLNISNKQVEFRASFSGMVHVICAPMHAILAVYAQENNQGMFFDMEEEVEEEVEEEGGSDGVALATADMAASDVKSTKTGAAHLRVVK